ncbi:MAG TPA: plastocyanin/azurin family copper-binding protein [Nitrospiria bacterium]|nr:plastocyanin/azurin family copper-binding protein [Nitrospiria bacterium]
MRKLIFVISFQIVFFSLAAGVSPGEEKKVKDVRGLTAITVEKGTLAFSPKIILVKPGTAITFANQDDREHFLMLSSATSSQTAMEEEPPLNEPLPPGAKITHKITHIGIYPYFCGIHNQMWGMVMVDNNVGSGK